MRGGVLRFLPLLCAFALALGACAPPVREAAQVTPPTPSPTPPDFPRAAYEQAAARGQAVYRIVPARSRVLITVGRSGSLSYLGHAHVVASHAVQGYVAPGEGRADLFVPLAELTVDEPALRAEAGLPPTQPSEAAIAGTRANMLDKVLHVQQFPFALIAVRQLEPTPWGARLAATLTLHGASRTFELPARMETDAARGEIHVAGQLTFKQSDFGIVPFSMLDGAIAVQDSLDLYFDLRASRANPASRIEAAP